MIKFVLMVNKQGQTRLASYFEWFPIQERVALEAEIIRRCLSRTEYQCSFIEYRGYKVVYRRYASLFFVVAVDSDDDNELSLLEFIHSLVETMDKYFESVCELDVSHSHHLFISFLFRSCSISKKLIISSMKWLLTDTLSRTTKRTSSSLCS
jgi:AP-4 complex subunit sigma-1